MHALIRLARCFCVQMPRLLLMLVPLLLEMAASLQLTQVCCRHASADQAVLWCDSSHM
jgi:hypothetical protein